MVRLGWHPFRRLTQGAQCRPAGPARGSGLRALVGQRGHRWRGDGTALRARDCPLECPLVAWWGAGHAAPWFIRTAVAPAGCDARWSGRRTWGAQRFNGTKRGGGPWP